MSVTITLQELDEIRQLWWMRKTKSYPTNLYPS